jgi:hypothetical protein
MFKHHLLRPLTLAVHLMVGAVLWTAVTIAGCSGDDNTTNSSVDASVDVTLPDVATTDTTTTMEASPCPTGQMSCGGKCVDVTKDPNNCGGCGGKCGTGLVCSMGACSVSCMGTGEATCGGVCTNTQSDPNNCGGCGKQCTGGLVCSQGQCQLGCTGGTIQCGMSCVNKSADNANCGKCGNVCPNGTVCSNGNCTVTCGLGLTSCTPDASAAYCANLETDNINCGACGNVCPQGLLCSGSTCGLACKAGLVNCNGSCIDPKTDKNFCGASGACSADAGTAGATCTGNLSCQAGMCQLACGANQINCGGQCVDPSNDPNHCGASAGCDKDAGTGGSVCVSPQVCNMGGCTTSCGTFLNCNGSCIDPNTNPKFCGATAPCQGASAGQQCQAGQACNNGSCILVCQAGLVNCGGFCIDPNTNPNNCGASGFCQGPTVGTKCLSGQKCQGGVCTLTCQQGLVECPTAGGPKCIDPTSDPTFCGATPGCGQADAGGGEAGTTCMGGQVCLSSVCGISCPQVPTPEIICAQTCVDPKTNRNFCGATDGCGADGGSVGKACDQGLTCVDGGCSLLCPTSPTTLVQEVPCTGICIDPTTDNNHCGATGLCNSGSDPNNSPGAKCPAGQACNATAGPGATPACAISCQSPQLSCPDPLHPTDGGVVCIDPNTSVFYCGAQQGCTKFTACDAGTLCSPDPGTGKPACQATCAPPYIRCTGQNTCSDLANDPNNCGTCGTACGPGNACAPYAPDNGTPPGRCTQTVTIGPSDLINQFQATPGACPSPTTNMVNGFFGTFCTAPTCTSTQTTFSCSLNNSEFAPTLDYGFQWQDNNSVSTSPRSITITLGAGISWDNLGTSRSVTLNGTLIGSAFVTTSNQPAQTCPGSAATQHVITISTAGPDAGQDTQALSGYVAGGINKLIISIPNTNDGTNNCEGLSPLSGGKYASVLVVY